MSDEGERQVWNIQVFIEATEAAAAAATEAIHRALCPEANHPDYCPVPWATLTVRFADLDEPDREIWQRTFDEEREAARRSGTPGA
ncbi:MAG TPA: hypothetical protein VHA57_09705 [Actinomycetota bacterium]|nr:hypothetical protein [Actinomycetota bacterium]